MAIHQSPKGRPVEVVEGDGEAVRERGRQIVNLGAAMSDAESPLTRLVNDGADMEGKAIDKLRELSGEVNAELGRAAELYEAVGPYVRDYGSELAAVKTLMNTSVSDAESYRLQYQQKLSEWQSASMAPVDYPEDAGDDVEASTAAERAHANTVEAAEDDKDDAYLLWKGAADDFDDQYDRWETAFDDAVAGVRSSTANAIEDSSRDNLDGFVDFALDVLAVAGVVLAVLAHGRRRSHRRSLALTVGVLALAGTLWQYSRGDAERWEVGLAVLGVLPFGAFGEFAERGIRGGNARLDRVLTRRAFVRRRRRTLDAQPRLAQPWPVGVEHAHARSGGGLVVNSFDEVLSTAVSGQDPFMWEVIGELGTTGQQITYAFSAVGTNLNNIATLAGSAQGAFEFATGIDRVAYPTWRSDRLGQGGSVTSLREQLGGGRRGIPEFRMALPDGWTMYDTSGDTERSLLEKARVRLREAHRPDVYAALEAHVTGALAAARKQGAFVTIMAGEDVPARPTVPVSILGTVTEGAAGSTLDAMVADAVERRGARALEGSRRFLRWVDRRVVESGRHRRRVHRRVSDTGAGYPARAGAAVHRDAGASHRDRPCRRPAHEDVARAPRRAHADLRVDRAMTRVTFEIDRATAIVLPGPELAGGDVDAWAAESAAALLAHHDLPAHQHAALPRVLTQAQRSAAEDASTNVLTFEPETGAWAPLRLTILDRSIDTDEQLASCRLRRCSSRASGLPRRRGSVTAVRRPSGRTGSGRASGGCS